MADDDEREGIELLAAFRSQLRGYLAWAETEAKARGTTPAQVQLLLAVYAAAGDEGPTITEIAQTLQLRHHSAVGLIDRAETAGLVRRVRGDGSGYVHVRMTATGERFVRELAALHLDYLAKAAPDMQTLWSAFSQLAPR